MMSDLNPYQAPTQSLTAEGVEEYGAINVFSTAGRLGRLRFIAYSILFSTALYIVAAISLAAVATAPDSALGPAITTGVMGLLVIAVLVVTVMLTSQRLHDTDSSGLWVVLMVVPIVSLLLTLYLWFWPGTKGANKYGNPPPPNGAVVYVVAVFGLIAIIGILAAIAIPAYQDYVMRAQQAAMGQP